MPGATRRTKKAEVPKKFCDIHSLDIQMHFSLTFLLFSFILLFAKWTQHTSMITIASARRQTTTRNYWKFKGSSWIIGSHKK